ncbi:hypothetical protein GGX14DRAFT_563015 [Mycena pura]|uniref:Uncharacterized protein n=1 Tax=Mycena pura TaxID=153505 RepID=A0AAD6VLA0_9AGAR|nr:hypothetical protein GGX14DRAFT_563015 [Mycena pura]
MYDLVSHAQQYINHGVACVDPHDLNAIKEVNPGATVHGHPHNGNKFNYNSELTNVGGTRLNVKNVDELEWATETLEAYGIKKMADYPAGQARPFGPALI